MKQYLEDLKKAMKNEGIKALEIEEILKDHEEMIQSALDEGINEDELIEKFGDPATIAKAIREDTSIEDNETEQSEYTLLKKFDVSDNEINIKGKLVNESIYFKTGKTTQIEVHVKQFTNENAYNIAFQDKTLTIERKNKLLFSFGFSKNPKFKIVLPADIILKETNINVTNGKIGFNGIQTKDTSLKTVNGDIVLKDTIDQKIHLTTINGKLKLSNITAKEIYMSLVSGDGKLKDVTVENDLYIRTVSGDIDLKNITAQELEYRSVSGDLKGKEVYPKDISLKSVSGDIYLQNKNKDHQINVKRQKSISGKVVIE